jgi:hypothetical protein
LGEVGHAVASDVPHPRHRRISLQCRLGNLHWRDFHPLDHQLASLHHPTNPQCWPRRLGKGNWEFAVNSILPTAIEGAGIYTENINPRFQDFIRSFRPMQRMGRFTTSFSAATSANAGVDTPITDQAVTDAYVVVIGVI